MFKVEPCRSRTGPREMTGVYGFMPLAAVTDRTVLPHLSAPTMISTLVRLTDWGE